MSTTESSTNYSTHEEFESKFEKELQEILSDAEDKDSELAEKIRYHFKQLHITTHKTTEILERFEAYVRQSEDLSTQDLRDRLMHLRHFVLEGKDYVRFFMRRMIKNNPPED